MDGEETQLIASHQHQQQRQQDLVSIPGARRTGLSAGRRGLHPGPSDLKLIKKYGYFLHSRVGAGAGAGVGGWAVPRHWGLSHRVTALLLSLPLQLLPAGVGGGGARGWAGGWQGKCWRWGRWEGAGGLAASPVRDGP